MEKINVEEATNEDVVIVHLHGRNEQKRVDGGESNP